MDGSSYELEEKVAKPFAVTLDPSAPGRFSGLGAVFGDLCPTSSWKLPMDWQDKVAPGAFAKTLAEHQRRGTKPAMLYQHERGNLCGAWSELGEVGAGLHAVGQMDLMAKTPCGSSLYDLMKLGGLTGLSPGFIVGKANLDEKKKVREITELALVELSVVDVPNMDRARVIDVQARGSHNIRALETALREAGLSREEAKIVLARGFSALREAGEAERRRDAASAASDDGFDSLLERFRKRLLGGHP